MLHIFYRNLVKLVMLKPKIIVILERMEYYKY